MAFTFGLLVWHHKYKYPYGWTHCCDKGVYLALVSYAAAHDGWYPRGESSPEASLSLLYRTNPNMLPDLPGKTVPAKIVREILEGGGLLGPETCGWHYVEGLRNDDDGRLGLFWDKVGLDHNGGRLPGGGHIVWRVDGDHDHIPAKDWPAFLAEQAELHKKLKREPKTDVK